MLSAVSGHEGHAGHDGRRGASSWTLGDWVRAACKRAVVRRALGYAGVVGAILIAINQGDALLRGELGATRAFKMALTVLVPYTVSTLSSVQSLREFERSAASAPP